MNKLTKQPSEIFIIEADFENDLAVGENVILAGSSVTAKKSDGTDATTIVIDAGTLAVTGDNKGLTVQVKNGAETDSPYTITFIAKTDAANLFELDVFLYVKEVPPLAAGGLTLAEMLSLFRNYIDDTDQKIPSEFITRIFNNNQNRVISLLGRHAFPKLYVPLTSQALDSNSDFDLSTLYYAPFNNFAIGDVKLTGGKYCTRISSAEYRVLCDKVEASTYTFTSNDPVYVIRGNKIHVEPASTIIDMNYMREPTLMEVAADPDNNVDCEFNYDITMIILGLSCETYIDEYPAAARAYNSAITMIRSLGKYTDSESAKFGKMFGNLGIPTAGKGRFNIYNLE